MAIETLAAIDLGSNSFHMIVARLADGQLQIIDRLKEMVQLRLGMDRRGVLSEEAQNRGLECLSRFGQRLRDIPSSHVRIAGTNTLRRAKNGKEFVARAETVLDHPIEIVSGMEEARLIYLGVSHCTADVQGQRLVIDIGGGSTELIIGERFEPIHLESLEMGCVSTTQKTFAKAKIREAELRLAELLVRVEMEPVEVAYRDMGWGVVTGSSGSIKAIRDVVVQEGWSHDGITLDSLRQLRNLLKELTTPEAMASRWNLSKERAAVFTGGFAVLHGVCEVLNIQQMQVSDCAMREGLIYDLVGRISHEDVRDRTIATLMQRGGVDSDHAERVAATALSLLEQVRKPWELEDEEHAQYLEWAARLHEIGLAIAHSGYHKHGAYVLQHADMPGFSRTDQSLLAALVRGHRRKFPLDEFQALPDHLALVAQRLCILLRLAVLLHRSRSRRSLPPIQLKVTEPSIDLRFPGEWLEAHPLTRADLQTEAENLSKANYLLSFDADT